MIQVNVVLFLILNGLMLLNGKDANSISDKSKIQVEFDLAKSLLVNDEVFVPPGDHFISKTIVVPSNKKIKGIIGKSKLIASRGFAGALLELKGVTNVEISGISFEGNQKQFSKLSNICSTRAAIRKFEGRMTGVGIFINNGTNDCWIQNCEFRFFGDACIKGMNAGGRTFPIRINDVSMTKSYSGIDIYAMEYSPATSVTVTNCVFGMILDAGNQFFSACSYNDNRIGLYLGSTHPNNSHGGFTACNFNHSVVYSIFCDGIKNGETFAGCQVFQGDIFLENTSGFIFTGGIIDAQVFAKGGNTSLISNTGFIKSYGGGKFYPNFEGSSSRLLLKNNFFLQEKGENDSKLNN